MARRKTITLAELLAWSKEQAREHRKKARWMRDRMRSGLETDRDHGERWAHLEEVLARHEHRNQRAFRFMAR